MAKQSEQKQRSAPGSEITSHTQVGVKNNLLFGLMAKSETEQWTVDVLHGTLMIRGKW